MTAPAEALRRVLTGCLLGLGLGGWYEFLRPLRRRFPHLCDLLLLAAFGCCWIFFGFQICRGDLRLGYDSGLFLGAFFFRITLGKLLGRAFSFFWEGIFRLAARLRHFAGRILKKIRKNRKK